jgi:hypothetical protein
VLFTLTSRPRGRRLDQGKHRVHRLCWIPRRLKSAHGPRGHASLTNRSTAVRPALLKEGCGRFLHVRRTLSRGARLVLARIACFMVRFSVTDTMALFCSESTFAHRHVATAYIRCSCAGYAPTPVMLSMGAVPLRSMLGQFLCHASRKAPSLRKVLIEKVNRSRGSVEGRLRVNRAVLIGCQVSAHAHAPRRLPLAARAGQSRAFSCERPASPSRQTTWRRRTRACARRW